MSGIKRTLDLLDYVDRLGDFTVEDLVREGENRSTTFRRIAFLVDAGLLARRNGVLTAGPRYNRQPAGTRFDRQSRRQAQIEEMQRLREQIKRLREQKVSYRVIGRMLGISQTKLRMLRNVSR